MMQSILAEWNLCKVYLLLELLVGQLHVNEAVQHRKKLYIAFIYGPYHLHAPYLP